MNKALILAAAPIALLAACTKPAAPADADAVLAEIKAVEQRQIAAFNVHDLEGAITLYAPDAQFLGPDAPVGTGTEAIRAAFTPMIEDSQSKIAITPGPAWVAASGELAVTSGTFTYTHSNAEGTGTETMTGAVQTVWQKDPDGEWKVVSDFNAATPSPAAPAPEAAGAASPAG